MGLLSGAGGPKGLFGNPDMGDAFAQAHAFLNDDYGTGIDIAARRFRRGRTHPAFDVAKEEAGDATGAGPDKAAAPNLSIGAIVDDHRYLGGDPREKSSWQPLDAMAAGASFGSGF